jgi:hypothetical protein
MQTSLGPDYASFEHISILAPTRHAPTHTHINPQLSTTNPRLFSSQPEVHLNGSISFTPASYELGTAVYRLDMQDSGGRKKIGSLTSGEDTADSRNITINVRDVNDSPSFVAVNVTVPLELDSSSIAVFALNVTSGPRSESWQNLTWVSSYTPINVFAARPRLFVDLDSNGSLVGYINITAATIGQVAFTVYLRDNGAAAPLRGDIEQSPKQTFLVNVNPINIAPSFDPTPTVTILESSRPILVRNFAQNVTKGSMASWEQSQELSYSIYAVDVISGPWTGPELNMSLTVAGDNSAMIAVDAHRYGEFNVTVQVMFVLLYMFFPHGMCAGL